MKTWVTFGLFLVASVHQATAQSCNFFDDQFFGYSCELNDATVTQRDQELRIVTDNHLSGRTDSDVRHFTINPNTTRFEFFPNSLFAQFPNMRYLFLDRSGLTELTPFVGCGNIAISHIRFTQIRSVPAGIFDNCTNLAVLDISDNEIETIHDDAFANMPQLLELDINQNRLQRISNRWFRNLVNLEDLNIRFNNISEIDDGAFSNLTSLITFYLRNNRISEIRPEMFGDEISLVFFNLNNNNLGRVPQLPSRAPRLKYIYLAQNNIYQIREGDFTFAYSNITNIDLSQNFIQTLPAAPFEVLQRLDILNVNDNVITAVDFELFERVPSLYTVFFLHNDCANVEFDNIRSIDQDEQIATAFDHCYYNFFTPTRTVTCRYERFESSYTCNLEGLSFQNFRDRFEIEGQHLEGLTDDDVDSIYIDSSFLFRVPPTLFEKFPNLRALTIRNSELQVINERTFERCGKITTLDVSRNRIRRIPTSAFRNCEYVEDLNLDGNQITEIAPCNSFITNIYQVKKISMRNNICVNQIFEDFDGLVYDFERTMYPYLNRCFSLWYQFLDLNR